MAQVIIAMAHHDYLSLEGGHVLVQFLVDQCAADCSADNAGGGKDGKGGPRPPDDHVTLTQLRGLCENVFNLSVTTIPCMRQVLWPYLLEFVAPVQYTRSLPIVCKSLAQLAEKLREEVRAALEPALEMLSAGARARNTPCLFRCGAR